MEFSHGHVPAPHADLFALLAIDTAWSGFCRMGCTVDSRQGLGTAQPPVQQNTASPYPTLVTQVDTVLTPPFHTHSAKPKGLDPYAHKPDSAAHTQSNGDSAGSSIHKGTTSRACSRASA